MATILNEAEWSKPKSRELVDKYVENACVHLLIPTYQEIPKEFKYSFCGYWQNLAARWFYEGVAIEELNVKQNINTNDVVYHLIHVLQCFDLRHEHKMGGVAYLLSRWCNEE